MEAMHFSSLRTGMTTVKSCSGGLGESGAVNVILVGELVPKAENSFIHCGNREMATSVVYDIAFRSADSWPDCWGQFNKRESVGSARTPEVFTDRKNSSGVTDGERGEAEGEN